MAIVRVFSNELEAEVAMSALEAAGIECIMRRDDCGGVQPAMGLTTGIHVIVPDEDLDAAHIEPLPAADRESVTVVLQRGVERPEREKERRADSGGPGESREWPTAQACARGRAMRRSRSERVESAPRYRSPVPPAAYR